MRNYTQVEFIRVLFDLGSEQGHVSTVDGDDFGGREDAVLDGEAAIRHLTLRHFRQIRLNLPALTVIFPQRFVEQTEVALPRLQFQYSNQFQIKYSFSF